MAYSKYVLKNYMFNVAAAAISTVLLMTVTAQADSLERLADSYRHYYINPKIREIGKVPNRPIGSRMQSPLEISENNLCADFYQKVAGDGIIRMHISFGYFDDSEGKEFKYGFENFGFNASTDEAWYQILQKTITQKCSGNLQYCAFVEVAPGTFVKKIKSPTGQKVTVEIRSEFPSVTPYYLRNTGEFAPQQQARSEASRQAFMSALRTDDAVFYVGHSRNGGGPDFYPPKLLPNGHANYAGHYQVLKAGVKDMLSAIKDRGEAPPMLGMMSCLSEAWFGAKLAAASPHTAYLFTQHDKLIGIHEHFNAMVAVMDGMMRFQCGEAMAEQVESVKTDSFVQELLRNTMTKRRPIDLNAKPGVVHD